MIFLLRAMRIDMLRSYMIAAGEAIQRLEERQLASQHVRLGGSGKMATRLRQPVPHFLHRGGAK
jgi:hypothetical protein